METTAIQKFIHRTPRKLRLVADMVRKMQPNQAVITLGFTPKAAAKDLSKAIKVALADAKGKGLNLDKIVFKKIEINGGPTMKRMRPGSRGRANLYQKKMSHIKIVLSDDEKVKEGK